MDATRWMLVAACAAVMAAAALAVTAADDDAVPMKVVMAIAEPEYKTHQTLPAMAQKIWTPQRGYEVTLVQGDPSKHDLPGLVEALKEADVLVLSVRRQALPTAQLDAVKAFLSRGGSLISLRTSSHAFDARGRGPDGGMEWAKFGAEVLGCNYTGHHGNHKKTQITVASGADRDAIVSGVEPYTSAGSLYRSSPLADTARMLLIGTIEGQPAEPVAWTNRYGQSRVFATSLGHESDFASPSFERLMDNAMKWAFVPPDDRRPAAPEAPAGNPTP